jgi:hypothetical protein
VYHPDVSLGLIWCPESVSCHPEATLSYKLYGIGTIAVATLGVGLPASYRNLVWVLLGQVVSGWVGLVLVILRCVRLD